jgi:hypothetical protein
MLAFINRYFSHLVLERRHVIRMKHLDDKHRLLIVIEMEKFHHKSAVLHHKLA